MAQRGELQSKRKPINLYLIVAKCLKNSAQLGQQGEINLSERIAQQTSEDQQQHDSKIWRGMAREKWVKVSD